MALLRSALDPYASVRVAVYEPLLIQWVSVPALVSVLTGILERKVGERTKDVAGGSAAPTIARFLWSAIVGGERRGASPAAPSALVRPAARGFNLPLDELTRRAQVVRKVLAGETVELDHLVDELSHARLPHLLTTGGIRHALSPVGVMHLYRQLYFDSGASLGPFEHAFTVAPKEQMEVVQESTRRDSIERTETFGTEATTGGVETGDQTVAVQGGSVSRFIEISIPQDPSRRYLALTIDSIADAAPEKDAAPPGILDAVAVGTPVTATGDDGEERIIAVTYRFSMTGDARLVTVTYAVAYEPSESALATWNDQLKEAYVTWEAQQLEVAFERAKRLIEARSRVLARPSADLREEERYELLNRMISLAFHDVPQAGLPTPIEVELFNRYFEVPAMFYAVHPAWWRPRYGAARDSYEITDESEPVPFGKSLGWLIQLDGDRRRNELLNSPWVRVCLPIRPGVEREALDWLGQHIEGRVGYSLAEGSPLHDLLATLEARRENEHLASPGPDYVTQDGSVAPGREASVSAYPVVDEFEVTVPTEGFIYERITTE
jgi:hypothetical protein